MAAFRIRANREEASLSFPTRPHPDVESEQAYFLHAYECLKDMQARRATLGDGGGDPKALAALERMGKEAHERLEAATAK